jgi:hypothetical protein
MDSTAMTIKSVDQIERLVRMSDGARNGLGLAPNVSQHSLNRLAWFADDDLVDLFDNYPRERLRVWQSRANLQKYTDWEPVDTTGITGREMLECLYKGSLWFNFQRIDLVDERYRRVSERLYGEIAQECRNFSVDFIHSYLLVSSPRAMVYLHLDAYENLLFVIRGGKIFHLYPTAERRMVPLEMLEDICSGSEDFFEYRSEFEQWAKVYTLEPGQFLSWPQHSPHRTRNNDELSVCLGTFHGTPAGIRRAEQLAADRFFRLNAPWLPFAKSLGRMLDAKRFGYRVIRKLGAEAKTPKEPVLARARLSATAPTGVTRIEGDPVVPEFARLAQ